MAFRNGTITDTAPWCKDCGRQMESTTGGWVCRQVHTTPISYRLGGQVVVTHDVRATRFQGVKS